MSTTSNTNTSVLRVLHRIHRQLTDLRERLERGPRQIQIAQAHAQHSENQLTKTKADAKTLRMAADQKQLQLKTNEEKVKDLRRKLNAAASNREYQALLEQIAADEMAKSVLEDEILEAFEKVDAFQKNIADAEAVLAASKKKAEEVAAEVAKQEPLLQGDMTRLEIELKEAEAQLPEDIRDFYQRAVRQKGEDALAVIENQFCSGCNQQIPLNLCAQVMLGKPLPCKTCGRLLYLPE